MTDLTDFQFDINMAGDCVFFDIKRKVAKRQLIRRIEMKKSLKMAALVIASMLVLTGCEKTQTVDSASNETSVEKSVETSVEASVEASVETSTETSVEASVETSTEASVEEEVAEASVETPEEEKTDLSVEVLADESDTLETYLAAHPREAESFRKQENSTEGLKIEVKGNIVYYIYSMTFAVTEEEIPMYDEVLKNALSEETAANEMVMGINLLESAYGKRGIEVILKYVDINGVEISHVKFNNKGIVNE